MRFPLELGIRDLKQHVGLGHYQCTTGVVAMSRFVGLTLVSFCLWRLVAVDNLGAGWLQDSAQTSPLRFTRISRGIRRVVVRSIFKTSASEADLQNSTGIHLFPNDLLRLIV